MSIEEKMLAAGGQVVIGTMYIDHVAMGHYQDGAFVLTDEGHAWAVTEDDEPAKLEPAPKKAKTKPATE